MEMRAELPGASRVSLPQCHDWTKPARSPARVMVVIYMTSVWHDPFYNPSMSPEQLTRHCLIVNHAYKKISIAFFKVRDSMSSTSPSKSRLRLGPNCLEDTFRHESCKPNERTEGSL